MTNFNNAGWRTNDDGTLENICGLKFQHDKALGWVTTDIELEKFQAVQKRAGIPLQDTFNDIRRLVNEAAHLSGPDDL